MEGASLRQAPALPSSTSSICMWISSDVHFPLLVCHPLTKFPSKAPVATRSRIIGEKCPCVREEDVC